VFFSWIFKAGRPLLVYQRGNNMEKCKARVATLSQNVKKYGKDTWSASKIEY
jgi:hypothetical protein